MNATIHYSHSRHAGRSGYPDQLHIHDDRRAYVTVFIDTVEQAERLLATVTSQRDALAEAEAKAAAEPEPVDGCTCGHPDLPSFDHNSGCPRRTTAAA